MIIERHTYDFRNVYNSINIINSDNININYIANIMLTPIPNLVNTIKNRYNANNRENIINYLNNNFHTRLAEETAECPICFEEVPSSCLCEIGVNSKCPKICTVCLSRVDKCPFCRESLC